MIEDDIAYWRRREAEERVLSTSSDGEATRLAHRRLAEAYAARVRDMEHREAA